MILTLLMLCFSLVAHWLACIWFVIAEKEQIGNDLDWDIGKCVELCGITILYETVVVNYVEYVCKIKQTRMYVFRNDTCLGEN